VTLKLRLSDFTLRTHARSMARAVEGREEFARLAEGLLDQVLPLPQSVRLMGLTLSALEKKGRWWRLFRWSVGGNWICFEREDRGCYTPDPMTSPDERESRDGPRRYEKPPEA
jgi:hypothetical protein